MQFWLKFTLLLVFSTNWENVHGETSSAHLPLEARDDSGSQEEDIISTSYVLPNQIFNDGKPYYASKDPISGQLDFNAKKPAGIETAVNEVIDPKEKIVLSNSSPNIHDFLNLPVKYSSSKFVYPLVSSSYANLKYQGSNKNYITNKKPTSVEVPAITPTPEHNHQNKYTIPTTKLMAVETPTTVNTPKPTTSTTTVTTTSKKPTTTTTIKTTPLTNPTSTSILTSVATSTSIFTPPKYATVSRKPIPIASTTSSPKTTTTPTRKKFVPTKKYSPTSPSSPSAPTGPAPTTPLRFPDQKPLNTTTTPHSQQTKTTTKVTHTTKHPTKPSSIFPTESSSTSTTKISSPNTKPSVSFTQQQLPTQFPPRTTVPGSTTRVPNLDPADVYQTLGQKNTLKETGPKPPMTLADIFNSLAEEESAVVSNNQMKQGIDAQGNLIQPFEPSKPSPFAMQGPQYGTGFSARPTLVSTVPPQHSGQNQQNSQPQLFNNDQKVISGSQENYSNEYVSYQVQQPNVMKYRPAPGAINNVVISPGQNSASFVLGSQQQVGHNAFGTVEKEPLFGKDRPVQYGTVINELPPQKPGNYPQSSPSTPQQASGDFGSQEEPPAPPSPYQQLPLIGNPPLRPNTVKPPQNNYQNTQNNYHIETPYQPTTLPQNPKQGVPTSIGSSPSDTKELLLQSNIRFPPNEEQSEEQLSGPVAAGPPAGPQVNGHAQPLSLQQIQQTNNVAFPKTPDEELNQVQYQASPGAEDIQIQQHKVVTMSQHKQKLSFPQLPEHHTPSTHMEPPPPPPLSSSQNSEYNDPMKRPHLNRQHGPPPPFEYNEYTRKPIPGITRPNADRHLPNILPQFRPNAKISNGHPGHNFNQEPGNIRIPPGPPLKRAGPNLGPPQFAHRRQPLMQQPRYPAHRASDLPVGPSGMGPPLEANRRIYRLPPYGGQGFQYVDRMYGRRPMPYGGVRPNLAERHAPLGEPEVYKTLTSHELGLPPERMAAFEEEDLVINDPPQPVTPAKDRKGLDESKLEPVVTLQMLQSQKKPLSLPNDDTGSGEIQVPSEGDNTEENLEKPISQNGLYVVYPMSGKTTDSTEGDHLRDSAPAIAHVESATRSEYQNTPFSVVRDQPQEPILTVKSKKPQSLQQQSKTQPLKDKFPYPIEKPDPSYSELSVHNRVPGVLVAPRIVHGIHPTGTETPIAIAYTPTEPNPYRKHHQKYSNVNLASSVIGEIRTEPHIEDGLSNDFDLRGQNLEKNFMAPFYPSISLGTVTSAPPNGWNVLQSAKDSDLYEKNKINRADVVDSGATSSSTDGNTNLETDNFQPELQGGFKPIYPPGYKIDDHDESENLHQHESNNRPLALASYMESTKRPTLTTTSIPPTTTPIITTTPSSATLIPKSTTTPTKSTKTETVPEKSKPNTESKPVEAEQSIETSTKIPQTTPTPTQRKKTPFETSLEALLFGDDEDFENESRKQKAKAKSNPRIAPRSGPRSLKLS